MSGMRVLVAGATGVIGGEIAAEAAARGATVVPAGRDRQRLARVADRIGASGSELFDAYDLDTCAALAARAAERTSGLDAVLVAFGAVAFGHAEQLPLAIQEHLMTVNALGPMAVLGGALSVLGPGGAMGALTGVVVDRPFPAMASYRASKSALAAWLGAVRVEQHARRISVLDARLPHLDTGFAQRAVSGSIPAMPPGADLNLWVNAVLDGLTRGTAVLAPSAPTGPTALPGSVQRPRHFDSHGGAV
ncbi:SDR family NAD(P)-dependent oxidoreductase [Kitasatospora sp. NPDC057223]|uniref:SDR family NAD(P)-dependent oxidoreductase n=1 Tax=Kitasatospora sp. NPDC057223 TaxID=3346055 RepID=UPI0036288158